MLLETHLCNFGWKATDWTLKDPHGKSYCLADSMGEQGLLIAFICNHCPYVKAIIKRLVDDCNVLAQEGVNTIAIMSNDYKYVPEDNPDNMLKFAASNNMKFPYLIDETQMVGKAYGAVCTPDFFGFNNQSSLQYRGRLDNIKMHENTENRNPELLTAMRQIAKSGTGPKEQFASMGCSIKWR